MLAYLVDRNGAMCSTGELMAVLFDDDDHNAYYQNLTKKIKGTEEDKTKARELSEPLFKAYVARNVFGDEAFYPLYEPMDEILQKALEELHP